MRPLHPRSCENSLMPGDVQGLYQPRMPRDCSAAALSPSPQNALGPDDISRGFQRGGFDSRLRKWRPLIRLVLSDAQWERVAPLLPGKLGDPGRLAADNRRQTKREFFYL